MYEGHCFAGGPLGLCYCMHLCEKSPVFEHFWMVNLERMMEQLSWNLALHQLLLIRIAERFSLLWISSSTPYMLVKEGLMNALLGHSLNLPQQVLHRVVLCETACLFVSVHDFPALAPAVLLVYEI